MIVAAYLPEIRMRAEIRRGSEFLEFETAERWFIAEISGESNEDPVSIARARVKPGVTTAWHRLKGVSDNKRISILQKHPAALKNQFMKCELP
jgi:hypothetical protein